MSAQKYVTHARLTCQAIQGIACTLKMLEERSGQSRERRRLNLGETEASSSITLLPLRSCGLIPLLLSGTKERL